MRVIIPERIAIVCDFCQREGCLQQCLMCRRDFCLSCGGKRAAPYVCPQLCQECILRDDVKTVYEEFAEKVRAICTRRDNALRRLTSRKPKH